MGYLRRGNVISNIPPPPWWKRSRTAKVLTPCALAAGLFCGLGSAFGWPWLSRGYSVRDVRVGLPAGAISANIDAVACPSSSRCVGIGSSYYRDRRAPVFVIMGMGSSWTAATVQMPADAQNPSSVGSGVHSRGAAKWCQARAGSGGSQGFPAMALLMASSAVMLWAAAVSR